MENAMLSAMTEPLLTAGVLSDTHLPYRMAALPPKVLTLFLGVDVILHAGDVDRDELLAPLRNLAPVYAVRGNFHIADGSWGGRNLPYEITLSLAGQTVVLLHGHRRGIWGGVQKISHLVSSIFSSETNMLLNAEIMSRSQQKYPHADVIIFGHTHCAMLERMNGTLFLNPGAVAKTRHETRSVAKLFFYRDRIEAELIPLVDDD